MYYSAVLQRSTHVLQRNNHVINNNKRTSRMRLYRLRFLCGDARRRSLEIGLKFGLQVTSIGNGHDFLAVEGRIVFIFTQVDGLSHDTLAEIIFHEGALKSFISKIEMNGIAVCRTSGDGRESVTISCPVGNLQFTFAQCSDHCCQCLKSPVSEKYIQVDHITVAVDPGTSTSVLEWFEKCLNFKRFRINSVETDEGLSMFTADTGLNLLALQYRHCSEVGLQCPLTSEDSCDVKFVIAEPLSGSGPNQVATFLQQHRGPGVQHIGLLTTNIFKAMDQLRTTGVDFIQPPTEYYELVCILD